MGWARRMMLVTAVVASLAAPLALVAAVAPPAGAVAVTPRATTGILPPNEPANSITALPNFAANFCLYPQFDDSARCQTATLAAINAARAAEGLRGLVLPTNYATLSRAEQIFVVVNIERVDRGLPAIPGLVGALNQAALTGSQNFADPTVPTGYPWRRAGSIWAAGESSVLGSLYDWMYFDGPNSNNIDCKTPSDAGCWSHRDVILGTYVASPATMGAAASMGTYQGSPIPEYASLLVGDDSGATPSYLFTWAQEVPFLTPPPAVTVRVVLSGPMAGGTRLTLAGTNLSKVTSITFGSAGAGTSLSALADGSKVSVTAPPSSVAGDATIMLHSPQGDLAVGTFTYQPSGPSVPTGLVAVGAGSGRVQLTWTAPASTGGSPLTGTVVDIYVGNVLTRTVASSATAPSQLVTGLTDGVACTFRVAAVNALGPSGLSAVSSVVVTPFPTATAFVQHQYQDLVGRAPTASELATQLKSLTGGATAVALPAALRRSTDASLKVDPTTRLYFAYFLRIPDVGGLTYWVNRVRSGTSLQTVSDSFAASREFQSRYGALSNAAFVNLVYQNVLGRAGDASGVAYWTDQLDRHLKTRGQVMLGFSSSTEYKAKIGPSVDVAVSWVYLLGISPDQTSFDATTADLTSAKTTLAQMLAALLADPRYATRVAVS